MIRFVNANMRCSCNRLLCCRCKTNCLRISCYHELENGRKALVTEDQIVLPPAIELAVDKDAYAVDLEFDGLSHLYEHVFLKATKAIPS